MKTFFKTMVSILLVMPVLWAGSHLLANTGTNPNVLVSNGSFLYEYAPDGTRVRAIAIPAAPYEGVSTSRDLGLVGDTSVAVFQGTAAPILNVFNFDSREWMRYNGDGWSTANNNSSGGICAYGGNIFVTDMNTGGQGAPNGLVRFNPANFLFYFWEIPPADRVLTGTDYVDVTIGADNKMYGLKDFNGNLDVINPATLAIETSLALGGTRDIRAIAVNGTGDIYAASWNGNIYVFNSAATLISTHSTPVSNLLDIDLHSSGKLAAGSNAGKIVLTDTTFASYNVIDVSSTGIETFVAFGTIGTQGSGVSPAQNIRDGFVMEEYGSSFRAEGFRFTARTNGQITQLGGKFPGTRLVQLFKKGDTLPTAEIMVTSNGNWQYAPITPVSAVKGDVFAVVVCLEDNDFVDFRIPDIAGMREFENIMIEFGAWYWVGSPIPPTETDLMGGGLKGTPDIVFVPDQQ